MRAFYESTTAQFGLLILSTGALAAGFTDYTWSSWMDNAIIVLGIYGTKEIGGKAATAYKEKA